jgi:dUTP pyrophosphatase
MNKEIKEQISEILEKNSNADTAEQFTQILELPDEQFDAMYPSFKEKILDVFSSKAFQDEILKTLETNPIKNFEEESKGIKDFLEEIKKDDSISDNKKEFLSLIIENTVLSIYDLYKNPREKVKIKIQKLSEDAIIPKYAHDSDAGADVFALETTTLKPHTTQVIKTGIKIAIPVGYEIQVRPRSGLSLKTSLRVANSTGTIDSAYRGEVGIIMENTGNLSQTINKGDRIAQLILAKSPMITWEEVEELDDTDRGEGGFGSSGE